MAIKFGIGKNCAIKSITERDDGAIICTYELEGKDEKLGISKELQKVFFEKTKIKNSQELIGKVFRIWGDGSLCFRPPIGKIRYGESCTITIDDEFDDPFKGLLRLKRPMKEKDGD